MRYRDRHEGGEGYVVVLFIVLVLFIMFILGLAFGTGFEVARH